MGGLGHKTATQKKKKKKKKKKNLCWEYMSGGKLSHFLFCWQTANTQTSLGSFSELYIRCVFLFHQKKKDRYFLTC